MPLALAAEMGLWVWIGTLDISSIASMTVIRI